MHLTKVHSLQHRNYLIIWTTEVTVTFTDRFLSLSLYIYLHTHVWLYKEDMTLTAVHRESVHF